jgi:NTP pyrophosphatase (non-canonical NTP hydrolase)
MELKDLQIDINKLCIEKGWDKRTIPEVFILFSEEIGELAKEIRLHTGIKSEKKPDNKDNLRSEFADVLNYLMELANRFDIDLTDAYIEKRAINQKRIW